MNSFRLLAVFLAILSIASKSFASTPTITHFPAATEIVRESGYEGVILIYDLKTDSYASSDISRVDDANLPASTFKIFSTLAALQTGVIEGPESMIPWDHVQHSRTELNRDLTLREAFQISAVPHFQQLVQDVGRNRMQELVDANQYGNQSISGRLDHFWLSGDLRISPLQQIDFLKRLYHDDLTFAEQHQATVKDIMESEAGKGFTIRAKTGLTRCAPEKYVGWWVGWKETDDNALFFATMLYSTAADSDFINVRKTVTRQVLDAL